MIIGIDANWAVYEQAGIGKYTYNLIKALVETDSVNQYVLFCNFFRKFGERKKFLEEMVKDAKTPVKLKISPMPSAWHEWLTQTPIPAKLLYQEKIDVFHSPFFAGVPKNPLPNTVLTIHDLVFMKFPEHRGDKLSKYYLKRTKMALQASKKVIAVSESTKKDLIELLSVDPEKISVVYEGVDKQFKSVKDKNLIENTLQKYNLNDKSYILSVCTLEPRKNLARLVKAYSLLPNYLQQKYKLVLTGKKGWNNTSLEQIINDLNLKDRIVSTGFVSQEELPIIYNGAAVFAYPALYEGFGLPPLEALSCGTPVVTSNISSIPEVMGKAALLINPYKEEEIARAIKSILTDPELAAKMREMGFNQSKRFSWQKAARETVEVYKSLKSKV